MLTVVRYTTIMLCALALSLGLTQALVSQPDPRLVTAGAALLSATAASSLVLALLLRNRPGFALAAWGTFLLAIAGILWAILMAPGRQPAWLVYAMSRWPAPAALEFQQLLAARGSALVALSAWMVGFSLVVLSAIRQPVLRRAPRGPLPLMRTAPRRD